MGMSDFTRALSELKAPTRTLASAARRFLAEAPSPTSATCATVTAAMDTWRDHWGFVAWAIRTPSEREAALGIVRDVLDPLVMAIRQRADRVLAARRAQMAPSDGVDSPLSLAEALDRQAAVERGLDQADDRPRSVAAAMRRQRAVEQELAQDAPVFVTAGAADEWNAE
jgi:hypothetical protein